MRLSFKAVQQMARLIGAKVEGYADKSYLIILEGKGISVGMDSLQEASAWIRGYHMCHTTHKCEMEV